MDSAAGWIDISMAELSGSPTTNEIKQFVDDVPGIYVWRREIADFPTGGASEFEAFVMHMCNDPSAVIPASQIASSITLTGINIGQGDIGQVKKDMLSRIASTSRPRKLLQKHIAALERFFLPLYIGSATKLATRIYQHATGQTDFSRYVENNLSGDFSNLMVACLPVGKEGTASTQEYIELLEIIAQRLLAPVAVQRPG